MFVAGLLLIVVLIWVMTSLPVLTLLLSSFWMLPEMTNRECSCSDGVVDCSFRMKALLPEDICDARPRVLDVSWNIFTGVDDLCPLFRDGMTLCDVLGISFEELEVFRARGNMLIGFSVFGDVIPHLRVVDVSMNRLSNVFIGELDTIEEVNFSFNKLQSLPWSNLQTTIPNLKHVDLSYNSISFTEYNEFRHGYKIKSLNLSHNMISEFFDHGVEDLHSLEALDLSFNPLVDLYYAFTPFKNLKYLNFSQASIKKLSNFTFYGLESLEVLDISGNGIIHLPDGIFRDMLTLEYLDLSKNNLTQIEFKELDINLRFINNNNDWMPKKSLSELRTLDLSYNKITGIKSHTFSLLRKLRNLNLSHNALSYIMWDAFNKLEEIEVLDLSHNELTSLPLTGAFTVSKNLIRLDLSHNQLLSLSGDVFVGLGRLRELDASWNFVPELLEDVLAPLRQLKMLDVSWNVLRNVSGVRYLKELHFFNSSYNQLQAFPVELLRNCRIEVWLVGNEERFPAPPLCLTQDMMSWYAKLERAMYWPTASLPPLPWALVLAAAVTAAALFSRRLARLHTQLPLPVVAVT